MSSLKSLLKRWLGTYWWRWKRSDFGPKIFVIGYNKTGTTSLGKALKLLGYDHSSFNYFVWRELYKNGDIQSVIRYTSKFESFDDLPWLKEDMIPILDEFFPNSKWIYLTREEEDWKRSYTRWSAKMGRVVDGDDGWQKYLQHSEFVRSYFSKRQTDILELSVSQGNGFDILAGFLNKQAPFSDFPHESKSSVS